MRTRSPTRVAFPDYMHAAIGYYVYRLEDPRNNKTFYVGKGNGNRVFQHVAAALSDVDRVSLKLDRIREIEGSGQTVRHIIHRHGLTGKEAYEVEASLIDAYGIEDESLTNIQGGYWNVERGQMGAEDLYALYAAERVEIDVPALLLNLRRQFEHGLTAEQLYARSRGVWRVAPQRHMRVKHAMPVAFGIIREVYRIERWELVDTHLLAKDPLRRSGVHRTSKTQFRWRFDGAPDPELRDQYVGRAVAVELRGQSVVHWFDSNQLNETAGARASISSE